MYQQLAADERDGILLCVGDSHDTGTTLPTVGDGYLAALAHQSARDAATPKTNAGATRCVVDNKQLASDGQLEPTFYPNPYGVICSIIYLQGARPCKGQRFSLGDIELMVTCARSGYRYVVRDDHYMVCAHGNVITQSANVRCHANGGGDGTLQRRFQLGGGGDRGASWNIFKCRLCRHRLRGHVEMDGFAGFGGTVQKFHSRRNGPLLKLLTARRVGGGQHNECSLCRCGGVGRAAACDGNGVFDIGGHLLDVFLAQVAAFVLDLQVKHQQIGGFRAQRYHYASTMLHPCAHTSIGSQLWLCAALNNRAHIICPAHAGCELVIHPIRSRAPNGDCWLFGCRGGLRQGAAVMPGIFL